MIYLDNAAGSHPKPPHVAKAIIKALNEYGANPGRGNHEMTRKTAAMVEGVREKIAMFFDIENSSRVIFTAGATMSLNMAIFGTLKHGDTLVLPGMEHNAISRPAASLEDAGMIHLKTLAADNDGYLNLSDIDHSLRCYPRPNLIALTHGSNVCGAVAPLDEIATIARKKGLPLLVDAAQSGGLLPISMKKTPISLLALAGHKALYGPPGTGILIVSEKAALRPFIFGGTGANSENRHHPDSYPDHLEAGSLNVPGIAGLGAAISFVQQIGIDELYHKTMSLTNRLMEIAANIPGIRIYAPKSSRSRLPVLALNLNKWDPAEAAAHLDSRHGIAVRSGYHCAPAAHRALGTMEEGCLRFSPGWFNSQAEVEKVGIALAAMAR